VAYVSQDEAPGRVAIDLDAICEQMGDPPWRKPLVGTQATRWVLLEWPPGYVTVPHYDPRAVEIFHVLRGHGVFRFRADDKDWHAGPGAVLFAPQGVRHTIAVPGPEPLLLIASVALNEDAPDETIEESL
jgi:mannose-6-phosphate isomerase-like protein (cupin superfamily)